MFKSRRAALLLRSLPVVGIAAAAGGCGIAPDASQPLGSYVGSSGVEPQTQPGRISHAGTIVGVGGSNGEKLNVTVTKIVDPAVGATEFDQPDAGSHFVSVQFTLTNAGGASYNDSPNLGARVVEIARVQYATDLGLGQTAEWLVP